jgi:hypothetical protein
MDARTVDHAATRLRELRHEEWSDLVLAGATFALSLTATRYVPELALPLFAGGMAVAMLGTRAAWRRWEIVDRLAAEPDAYRIAEVREHAAHEATMARRRALAGYARAWLEEPVPDPVRACAADLEALAADLEDERLTLDPAKAVACARLLADPRFSPFLGPGIPQDELRSRIRQIRAGFESRTPPS